MINYQFLKNVYELLTSQEEDAWKKQPIAKLVEINDALNTSPKKKLHNKICEVEKKSGKSFRGDKVKMLTTYLKKEQDLKILKNSIEVSLEQGFYPLAIEPFNTNENVQLLLLNFCNLKCNNTLNSSTLNAFEGMLRNNFNLITKDFNFNVQYLHKLNAIEGIIKKLSENQKITIEDFFTYEYPTENIELVKSYTQYAKNMKFVDSSTLEFVYKKLQFILGFYENPDIPLYDIFEIILSQALGSKESIESFFEKHVNFKSLQTIEDSIVLVWIMPNLENLTAEELAAWRELVKTYGKSGLERFVQLDNFQLIEGFDITEILKLENPLEFINQKAETIYLKRFIESPEIANLCLRYKMPESSFNKILDTILPNQKKSDNLPDIVFKIQNGKYSFEKLMPGHIDGLFLGKMTSCCQFIDGDAEKCVIDGFTRDDSGFYVIRDKKGKIKAQTYAWIGLDKENKDVIVFDSFEYLDEAKGIFLEVVQEFKTQLLNQTEYKDLYVGTGGRTPSVNQAAFDNIKPKVAGLYQYDSKSTFKVTDDLAIAKNNYNSKNFKFESYDQFIMLSPQIAFHNLQEQYKDQLKNLDEISLRFVETHSVFFNKVLSNGFFSLEQITKFASDSCNNTNASMRIYNFSNDRLDKVNEYFDFIQTIYTDPAFNILCEYWKNTENAIKDFDNSYKDRQIKTLYEQDSEFFDQYLDLYVDSMKKDNGKYLGLINLLDLKLFAQLPKEILSKLVDSSGNSFPHMILSCCNYNFEHRKEFINLIIESFPENASEVIRTLDKKFYIVDKFYNKCPNQANVILRKVFENYSDDIKKLTAFLGGYYLPALSEEIIKNIDPKVLFTLFEQHEHLPMVVQDNVVLVRDYLIHHNYDDYSIEFIGHCFVMNDELFEMNL